MLALQILHNSLDKYPSVFTDQFSRLGLAMHLSNLISSYSFNDQSEAINDPSEATPTAPPPTSSSIEETDGSQEATKKDTKQEGAVS